MLHGDVEVVRAITFVERCFAFLPAVSPVVLKRRPVFVDRCNIFASHAVVNRRERDMVVVVRYRSSVVDDNCAFELKFAGFFTGFDDAVLAVSECIGREIAGTLDKTGLQREFLTNVRVRFVVECILRVRDFEGVVVPSVVSNVLCHLTELLERLIENTVFVLGDVELYLDISDNSHTS